MLLALGASALAAGSGARRVAAVAVAAAGLASPWLARGALLRALIALSASWTLMRVIELALDRRAWPLARRIWHTFGIIDARRAVRGAPRWDRVATAKAAGYALLAAAGLALIAARAGTAARWAGGVVATYGIAETLDGLLRTLYAAAGVAVAPIHDLPIASRSVGEFWGRRYNRLVSAWLATHCFRPLARRRHPAAGLAAAFAASAALHAFLVAGSLGVAATASMGAFFLVQGAVALAESPLHVARWPAPAAHAWTLAWMFGTAPLFVEPALRVVMR